MAEQIEKLLACAAQTSAATSDIIEAIRDGGISPIDNVGSGDTLTILADGLRLLIDAMDADDEEVSQLHGAIVKFLEDRT